MLNEVVDHTSSNLHSSKSTVSLNCSLNNNNNNNINRDKYFEVTSQSFANENIYAINSYQSLSSHNPKNNYFNNIYSQSIESHPINNNLKLVDMNILMNREKQQKYIKVGVFLSQIRMSKYETNFILNGFDNLDFIVRMILIIFSIKKLLFKAFLTHFIL